MKRETIQIHTQGKYESIVAIEADVFPDGRIAAGSEDEHLTEAQFRAGLEKEWPDVEFTIRHDPDYWVAWGKREV